MAEGWKDFSAGQVLGESDLDDYLMSQTVMRFANAAARDAALTEVEGMVAYLKDTDQVTVYDGSAWVILGYGGNVTSWTPVVTQSGLLTTTTNHATYYRQGKMVSGSFNVQYSSGASVSSNVVKINLPVGQFSTYTIDDIAGYGFIYDNSTNIKYRAMLVFSAVAQVQFLTLHSTTNGFLGTTDFTAALASNDVLSGNFTYEAASAST